MTTGAAGGRAASGEAVAPTVPPAWPRRPGRLGHAVLASLVEQVVSGRLPPGTQLPPEPALCDTFGVSRSVIRESLKLLEEKGLVRVRQGQGTTVQPVEQWSLLDPLVLDSALRNGDTMALITDLVEVRSAVESLMARRAAKEITDEQVGQLRDHLGLLEASIGRREEYVPLDLEFHDLIARFSGNQPARSVIRSLQPYMQSSALYNFPGRVGEDDVYAQAGHVAIFERLAARDAEGAARAVEEHVSGSWTRLRAKHLGTAAPAGSPATS